MLSWKIAGIWSFAFGILLCGGGILLGSIPAMSVGMLVVTVGYVLRDYFDKAVDSISPVTVTAVLGVWMALAHIMALFVLETPYEKFYYSVYVVMDYLLPAQILATLILIVPLMTYSFFRSFVDGPRPVFTVPQVGFVCSDKTLLRLCLGFLIVGWLGRLGVLLFDNLGAFGYLLYNGSYTSIFLLAWHWFGPSPTFPPWSYTILRLAPVADSLYSMMYSNRRGEIAMPFFVFLMAILLRKAVKPKHILIFLAVLPVFAFVYQKIGISRGGTYNIQEGTTRAIVLTQDFLQASNNEESATSDDVGVTAGLYSLLARPCQFGQLSQVARIADEEGFYYGETLSYLTYVFIPRIIWPDKPLVTPGQWFAEKIGRGQRLSDTKFSNSINMTLAGELYLNFGWLGTILGLCLQTMLYAIIWTSADFYNEGSNPIGRLLGLAVISQSAVTSSAAAIIYLISTYGVMLGVRYILGILEKRRQWHPQARAMKTTSRFPL